MIIPAIFFLLLLPPPNPQNPAHKIVIKKWNLYVFQMCILVLREEILGWINAVA